MSSNENAKTDSKKLSIRGCGCLLFIFALVIIIILAVIGKCSESSKEEKQEQQQQEMPEQVKKDSLTIEQEKKDSLLRIVNFEYNAIFRGRGLSAFSDYYCGDYEFAEEIKKIKSLVEQGATVETDDTLFVANALAELEEQKKDMFTLMQNVRKIAIKSGENIERLEKAYNMDSKVINGKIKNCKEIKKILVKNLNKNQ